MSYFHFTIGPVQSFVSQARRTRDFWAGSFLLSWLTAQAMKSVQKEGSKIVMPFIENDELLARVKKDEGKGPDVGSLPNNFIAEVPEGFDGNVAVQAVKDAWKSLSDKVWEKDSLAEAGVSADLWNEQIENFWDMSWVIADSDNGKLLAQRKNWRFYMPPESQGDKCSMMGEWQELSGASRPSPKNQKIFWDNIAETNNKGLDLREGERLCSIAYVKRRFVHVWQDVELSGVKPHAGWSLPTSVPSTSYMAAVHWLEKLINAEPDKAAVETFYQIAQEGERTTRIACISKALKEHPSVPKRLADVDGRLLFGNELEQLSKAKKNKKGEISKEKAIRLREARDKILASVKNLNASLSPFYAVLMMDGDSLGETKAAMEDATTLSAALGEFTQEVPNLIKENDGFLIYTGGDDLLAILPLEDALPCAAAIRQVYMKIFKSKNVEDGKYSISAAIEYAHMKLPLTMILKDAHNLLDDVAKNTTGRDAVACRVWKPGGQQQTWAMPWNEALDHENVILVKLANKLGVDEKGEPGYASKFLYHIRETLEMLDWETGVDSETIQDILVADYVGSGLLEGVTDKLKEAQCLIEPLLNQCRVYENKTHTGRFVADGALLLRFLAQKGVE